MLSGIDTVVNAVQFRKAPLQIVILLSGRATFTNEVPKNAPSPIFFTLFDIVNSLSEVQLKQA